MGDKPGKDMLERRKASMPKAGAAKASPKAAKTAARAAKAKRIAPKEPAKRPGSPTRQWRKECRAATSETIAAIGARLRALRIAKGLTLSAVAERTGLSPSMLSLLERGRTGPSIGTLVAICSVLGVEMSDLLGPVEASPADPVSRFASRPAITTADGVQHRILKADRLRGIEIVIDEYSPGSASAPHPLVHDGYEFGIALDNGLEVTVNGEVHRLAAGDLVAYHSSEPHRVANPGRKQVRALWVLVRKP